MIINLKYYWYYYLDKRQNQWKIKDNEKFQKWKGPLLLVSRLKFGGEMTWKKIDEMLKSKWWIAGSNILETGIIISLVMNVVSLFILLSLYATSNAIYKMANNPSIHKQKHQK